LAPASRAIWTISRLVVPRTIESIDDQDVLALEFEATTLSFWRTDFLRIVWPGMMKVRPI